ncbi:Oidioi.mRNA.OKI2018_I69.PAR.g10635.t1.cds [Oikopleura dioica]|uniref:Oidioi.mRNA.OKI2018_I69.PAR.g10635.t1.cds n=1 Tax=Oikopleura dioica TaxID=34765 RepID=A0ABN7RRU9_OIKDI|nr:Oidioi.mRNA.OKI2018_I69.PAR.g10635.t1.cds [Oikopleura dioica]
MCYKSEDKKELLCQKSVRNEEGDLEFSEILCSSSCSMRTTVEIELVGDGNAHVILDTLEHGCKETPCALDGQRDEDICRQTYSIDGVDVYCQYSDEHQAFDCCCSGRNCNTPEVWENWYTRQHRGEINKNCQVDNGKIILLSQILDVILIFLIVFLVGVLIRCIGCALIRGKQMRLEHKNKNLNPNNDQNSHALLS